MSPIKLLGLLFGFNLLAVVVAIDVVRPETPEGIELKQVNIQQPVESDSTLISGKPVRLKIEKADIDIEVVDGLYDSGSKQWTLSKDKAHYALMTPESNNQAGNTFIYGHNNGQVFSSLEDINPGTRATVIASNDKHFIYSLRSVREVPPSDVSLFEYQGDSILTVQTCSGTWYEKRKLFTFEFVEVV